MRRLTALLLIQCSLLLFLKIPIVSADDKVPPLVPAEEFADYIAQLDAAGFQVMVHAIGDGTVRATLDGFEKTIKANGNNRLHHHIDHCSLIHPDDFQRFVDLDALVDIQFPEPKADAEPLLVPE